MRNGLIIRPEQPADQPVIYELTEQAFRGRPYAGGDEQEVINRLRERGELVLSLVAELQDEVVGQITFSPAQMADDSTPWFALGPVSVLPALQSKGIGGALINQGLDEILKLGALGCILTGNPVYYSRFGFEFAPEHAPANEPAEFFMLKCFTAVRPRGTFRFSASFYD